MSVPTTTASIQIEQLPEAAELPMTLLLMADPDPGIIHAYIPYCIVLVAKVETKIVAVLAMSPETKEKAEIRNIAVDPAFRGKGIARTLLQEACNRANRLGYSILQVCTANSSIRQFKVYQQFGFVLTDVRWNYFTEHYPQPIIENDIPCKHQLVLSRSV